MRIPCVTWLCVSKPSSCMARTLWRGLMRWNRLMIRTPARTGHNHSHWERPNEIFWPLTPFFCTRQQIVIFCSVLLCDRMQSDALFVEKLKVCDDKGAGFNRNNSLATYTLADKWITSRACKFPYTESCWFAQDCPVTQGSILGNFGIWSCLCP